MIGERHLLRLTTGLLLCGLGLAQRQPQAFGAQLEEEDEVRAFQIYDTQSAKAIQQEAEEHLAAGRIIEGLSGLQTLIERHRGEVLGAKRPHATGSPRMSLENVHAGASSWALRHLFDLPEEAKEKYRERYGPRAQAALERALAAGDVGALVQLGGRWPLTRAAERAWWAVGDLETEAGRSKPGRVAWGRAMSHALGHPDAEPRSPKAWSEALETLASAEPAPTTLPGVRSRVELVLSDLEREDQRAEQGDQDEWASALQPGEDLGRPFSQETEAWPKGYQLPSHPFRSGSPYPLYPARSGDTVFVNTSREVLAVEAFTGEELWRSSRRDLGWTPSTEDSQEFVGGIDRMANLQAPAVDQGIVVASLQVPYLFIASDHFKELKIVTPIPERRLVAFDEVTGEELWNTLPPGTWDGESGTYAERANVVGPPVIAAGRVFVPTARIRGRIEFHLGCFDLATGKTLWHAPLITGQRELNMFGREEKEFCAPPVVIEGDQIFISTQLGTVASLDLFTGDVLWQSLYPQLPISKPSYYTPGHMASVWSNAPPALAGNCLVVTPADSRYLLGFDRQTGSVLWRLDYGALVKTVGQGSRRNLRYLVGADENHVILGGQRVASFRPPSGNLVSSAPSLLHWTWPVDDDLSSSNPRPVIDAARLYIPRERILASVDRATGRLIGDFEWDSHKGNLLVTDGQLFSLGPHQLWGFFEWDAMLERAAARLAEAPDDERVLVTYARLLLQRGSASRRSEPGAGTQSSLLSKLQAGLQSVRQSRQVLEDYRARGPAGPEVERAYYDALQEQARIHFEAGDRRAALEVLEDSLANARKIQQRVETLMLTQAALRDFDEGRRRQVLTTLVDEFGQLRAAFRIRADDWRPGQGTWQGSIEAASVLPSRANSGEHAVLPIGLWGIIERAESRRGDRSPGVAAHQYTDLHRILAEYPDEDFLGAPVSDWAADRIGDLRAQRIDNGYARFAEAAQELFDQAVQNKDLDALARVPQLYPYSEAAGLANDARIGISLARGNIGLVSHIVLGELEDDWSMESGSERQIQHLVLLAEAIGEAGNLDLRAGLAARLAQAHGGQTISTETHGSRSLKALAKEWVEARPGPVESPVPTFGPTPEVKGGLTSGLAKIGGVRVAGGRTLGIFVGREPSAIKQRIYAFGDDPEVPIWAKRTWSARKSPPFSDHFVLSPGLVHVGDQGHSGGHRLITLDAADGEERWTWTPDEGSSLVRLAASDGVVVAVVERSNRNGQLTYLLVGVEASTGAELWRLGGIDKSFTDRPVVGEGYAVLLPRNKGYAEAIDIYTGTRVSRFHLGSVQSFDGRGTWIENGQLIVPSFIRATMPAENRIRGFDLVSGERAWSAMMPRGHELHRVLQFEGNTVLQLNRDTDDDAAPSLHRLNVRLGSMDQHPLASLPPGSLFLGLPNYHTVTLEHSLLLAFVTGPSGRDMLRAVDVRLGPKWDAPLPDGFRVTHATDLPRPAASDSTVALALAGTSVSRSTRAPMGIIYLSRGTGSLTGQVLLPTEHARPRELLLHGIGGHLLVSGIHRTELVR